MFRAVLTALMMICQNRATIKMPGGVVGPVCIPLPVFHKFPESKNMFLLLQQRAHQDVLF